MRSSGFRFCILVCDTGSTQIGGREPFSPETDAPLADPWAAPLSVTSLLSVSVSAHAGHFRGDIGTLGVCSSGRQSVRCWRPQF